MAFDLYSSKVIMSSGITRLPREAMDDSNDRGWFLGINHCHVTYFSL